MELKAKCKDCGMPLQISDSISYMRPAYIELHILPCGNCKDVQYREGCVTGAEAALADSSD